MPVLFSPDGRRYRTEIATEAVRLKAAGYTEKPERPPTVVDLQFHPAGVSVQEVNDYLSANPGDAERVIAEEKAGQARVTIIGKAPAS